MNACAKRNCVCWNIYELVMNSTVLMKLNQNEMNVMK